MYTMYHAAGKVITISSFVALLLSWFGTVLQYGEGSNMVPLVWREK